MSNTQDNLQFSRGSFWRKWDLHFHTPSSTQDYKNKAVTNEIIVDKLKAAGISVVAVTDHHTIDTVRIKRLQELGGNDLTVFPGIEMRTELGGREHIHIIGLFSEKTDIEHIWTTLQGQLGLTEALISEKGHDRIYVEFKKAAQLIRELGGLVSVHAGRKSNSIENISNAEAFKRAVKDDLAKNCIDILELGQPSDAENYKNIVFPTINNCFPMVIGSDNHDAINYRLKISNWIRADTTFEGLKQIINEPENRIFRGGLPPLLDRVAQNKTKYIDNVTIRKIAGSSLIEKWFDCAVPLNPGLIAIIGNKGSGKSALSDTIGLLGDTRHSESFSFLNFEKFRQPQNNKARHFKASLTWASGSTAEKSLDENLDQTAVETVKYVPQNYLETICNELRGGGESRFDGELKGVIFSHVSHADRLGKKSLDELIQYQTQEAHEAIELLRTELNRINVEIASLEEMLSEDYKRRLAALLERKERELEAHDRTKPPTVSKPELDPEKQKGFALLADAIEKSQKALVRLNNEKQALLEEQKMLARRAAVATKLVSKIENFRKQYQLFSKDTQPDFEELGLDAHKLVQVVIKTDSLTRIQESTDNRIQNIVATLNPANNGSLAARIAAQQSVLSDQHSNLDAPNREYQKYLSALAKWNAQRKALIGDKDTPDSLAHLKQRTKELETIPIRLGDMRAKRTGKAREIFSAILSLATMYKTLYKPVQDFIEHHPLAKQGLRLDFQVSNVQTGFETGFFNLVTQNRKGSFCGIEDGREVLKKFLAKTDWNVQDSVFDFLNDILEHLSRDHRQQDPPQVNLKDQLKKDVTVESLYNYLFSLTYIRPKYNLQWDHRDLDELSPGERGTVLLLFYLLLDSNTIPLVIDQPEENLDNQTVFNVLVPSIKEARNRRQIIIVTHNPNLAVVSDADQVIYAALEKSSGNKVTYDSGAIENPQINRKILDVLEGTRPAFDNRDSKYQKY